MQFGESGDYVSYEILYLSLEDMAKRKEYLDYIEEEYLPSHKKLEFLKYLYKRIREDEVNLIEYGLLAIKNNNPKFIKLLAPIFSASEAAVLISDSIEKENLEIVKILVPLVIYHKNEMDNFLYRAIYINNRDMVRYLHSQGARLEDTQIIFMTIDRNYKKMTDLIIDLNLANDDSLLEYSEGLENKTMKDLIQTKIFNKRMKQADSLSSEFPEKRDPESSK